MRSDGRSYQDIRHVTIEPNYLKHPDGSVLMTIGDTKIICSATIENKVPSFLRGQGKGWITAEYSLLPASTNIRTVREASRGKLSGRTMEIQRLIGRALRSVVDLKKLGEKTIWIDCDVIQADGGTRVAAITGSFVALTLALSKIIDNTLPITDYLAAISVGIDSPDIIMLDLNYEEDRNAMVDMNVVMTGRGQIVEIQGTGEEDTFSKAQLNELIDAAEIGISRLITVQKQVLGSLNDRIKSGE